jgi:hypothetical protein
MPWQSMARKSRIDAPGALHHIIIRGIERRAIFIDSLDFQNILERLGDILTDSSSGIQWRRCCQSAEFNAVCGKQTCFACTE